MNLQSLNEAIDTKDVSKIKPQLSWLTANDVHFTLPSADVIENLLKYENTDVQRLTIQLSADLAKSEENRRVLSTDSLIRQLKTLLKSESDLQVKIQVVRALGNLCYDNDDARKAINKDGLESLLSIMESSLRKADADNKKLITVSCGYLNNLLMAYDELQKASLQLNLLGIIENAFKKFLPEFEDVENIFTHLLFVLSNVSEHMMEEWFTESLLNLLVQILRISVNPEISSLCLELLRSQSENNDIKIYLAKQGTCELVYQLVDKHGAQADDEDSRGLLKMACDLVVLILTGDESMELLYAEGHGLVYQHMVSWLHSPDVDLLSTGVLAIGNFARNDSHCIQMVENGLVTQLLGILSQHNSGDGNVLLQHALLSALRNLSIPLQNKKKLLQENLLEILYKMLCTEQSPVVFKLLGTFRMVVDGQEAAALNLLQRKDFVEKLVYWCYNSDHLGVRGEAPRLLSWLIKNCHSAKPFPNLLSVPGCLKCLVEMISSMHAVMQTEAFLALNLLCAACLKDEKRDENPENPTINVPELFINADVGKHLTFTLNKYHEKMERGAIENALLLLEQLKRSPLLVDHLHNAKIADGLRLLSSNKNLANSDRIQRLIATF